MSIRRPASDDIQPKSFEFNKNNLDEAESYIAKYPKGRQKSAVMPLLFLAQKQNKGWIPTAAMNYIGELLDMPYIRVYEVATFYTMFNLQPVGKYHIQLCSTTPCWLRGSDEIMKVCKNKLKIDVGETTRDGNFTLSEVECLGACANAPMVQINNDYFEDLTPENFEELLRNLENNKEVKIGSQIGRSCSSPAGELTSLKEGK